MSLPSPPSELAPRAPRGAGRRPGPRSVGAVAACLVLALVAYVAIAEGTQREPRWSGTNSVFPAESIGAFAPSQRMCQAVRIPAGTGALEIPLITEPRPGMLRLAVYAADKRQLAVSAPNTRRAGWARFVLNRTIADGTEAATVCLRTNTFVEFRGSLAYPGLLTRSGEPLAGAMTIAYLRPGAESAFAILPAVVERIGRIREFLGGPARAIVIVALVLAGIALTILLLLGRLARRAALACATVALLNAFAWSLLTPVFQIPDEPFHTSYVQDLAVKGQAPRPGDPPSLSDELGGVIGAASTGMINFNPFARPVWDAEQAREWTVAIRGLPNQRNPGSYPNVVDYPPLYYGSLVPAYKLTHALGFSTLGAVTTMRLTSALYAGITVLALFAMLLELFPDRRWLATPVSLICAYQPVFVWISGGVNPDGALIALGAVMFWLFARGFRRGLTPAIAAGLTLAMVASYLVQVRGLGFGPGWAVGLALLLWRRVPDGWAARRRAALAAGLAGVVPLVLYEAVNIGVWDRPLIPGGLETAAGGTPAAPAAAHTSGFASFLWQYFLPRVGSMTDFFHVHWTVKDLWVPMWVGRFGWYDYQFPNSVNRAALLFYLVLIAVALVALAQRLLRDPSSRLIALVYALLAAGLVLAVAKVAYPLRRSGNTIFEQARYFMPLIPLYAIVIALAFGWLRRWARPALSVLVGASVLQLLAAFELTVQRYYL